MNEIEFRQAKQTDDFRSIAKCIYLTDPYIYPSAFGDDINSAVQAISIIITTAAENDLLNLKNIYVAVTEEKICGIILYNEKLSEWNTEKNYDKIREYISDKNRFEYASCNYFMMECKQPADNNVEIVAMCVLPEYRNRGIAYNMLKSFINEKKGKTISLDVLSGNISALKIYSALGFSAISEYKGFAGAKKIPPDCYHMIRK